MKWNVLSHGVFSFLKRAVSGLALVLAWTIGTLVVPSAAWAHDNDCIENGGKATCIEPTPTAWQYAETVSSNLNRVYVIADRCYNLLGLSNPITTESALKSLIECQPREHYGTNFCSMQSVNLSWAAPGSTTTFMGNPVAVQMRNGVEISGWARVDPVVEAKINGPTCETTGYLGYFLATRSRNLQCTTPYKERILQGGNIECWSILPPPPPEKEQGFPKCPVGNPCNPATGNKYQSEVDFTAGVPITRHYNSKSGKNVGLGVGWSMQSHSRVEIQSSTSVVVRSGDGRAVAYTKQANSAWFTDPDITSKLTQDSSGYLLTNIDGSSQRFDTTGKIISEQTSTGRTTSYNYTSGRLDSIVDPSGNTATFGYSPSGLISTVADGAGGVTTYSYVQGPVPQSYKEEVLADAPHGYWRLQESSGTTAAAEYGSNAVNPAGPGTYIGTYTLNQSGPVNGMKSVAFNANGDGEVVTTDTVNYTDALTMEMWVNPDAVQPEVGFLLSKSSYYALTMADFPISLEYYPSYGFALLLSSGNDWSYDTFMTSGSVTPGQWYHVVGVYRKNGQCELWVNGVLKASQTINYAISNSTQPWRIANAFDNSGGLNGAAFSGKISDAAVYWSPLSASRIQAHYYAINHGRDLLSRVDYPDGSAKLYHYEDPDYPSYLTGISHVEVGGATTRYATWGYDSNGKANLSEHNGGAQRYDIVYNSSTQSTVTDSAGNQRVLTFAANLGVKNVTSIVNQSSGKSIQQTFDSKNRLTCRKDEEGRITTYTYNANQKTSMTEGRTGTCASPAATTSTRTTTYAYASPTDMRLLSTTTSSVAGANKTTSTTYTYGQGVEAFVPLQITRSGYTPSGAAINRTTTYTYNSAGQASTIDGPRTDVTDVTTFAYYPCTTPVALPCGLLHTVTNALGHTTTYNTYNAVGQPLTITDANGVVTTLTYDSRRRLSTRTVGTETTTFDYYAAGHVKKVTMPDGSFISYGYDGAERLTSITDNEGNSVIYTLDSRGNRTEEKTYDPLSTLTAKRTRVFNILNQLASETGAAGTAAVTTTFGYDFVGNQTSVAAPLTRNTVSQYDELNHLKQVTDPASGNTLYGYNALDQLISVTDPRGNVTSYGYNDLGDLLQQVSPDTGTTTNTYDAAGNLATTTDARGNTTTHSYDTLNRVTQSVTTDQTIQYHYDTGTNGKGRLVDVVDNSGQTVWTYDPQGRPTSRQQIMVGFSTLTNYGYDSYGRPSSITFPSGHAVQFGYTNGKVTSITLNGSTTILSNVLYEPFGPIKQWTWGNNTTTTRTFDQDTKITAISSAGGKSYGYDDAFRITGITDASNSALSQTLGYDALDRLTSASRTGLSQTWTYDANGNRLTEGGTSASTFTNSSTSNRIASVSGAITKSYSYDNAGNTQSDGTSTFTYDQRGRMLTATKSSVTTTYSYNALGQRVKKSNSGSTRYFVYDEAGHLLGEYTGSGVPIQEIVWLGDIPVASIRANESGSGVGVFYIHTDHLNTPRKITRPSDDAIVWRWDSDPFGNGVPNEDADGNGLYVVFNLRFPGQYFDSETGLHYNYFRDYDPATGRYIEGDPTGLAGGLNLYAYVGTNPLSLVDPFGQAGQCANQPSFNPGFWNDGGRIQNTNNCYSYAWDRPENPLHQRPRPFPDKPQPGGFTGRPFENLTCGSIISASLRDGMSKPTSAGSCPACTHKVFLVIAPNTDYHWYRQDSDGTWSHKPGWTNATNLDASGNPITNPETANRNYGGGLNYSRKCGYLCAPNR